MATCADLEGKGWSRGSTPFCKIHIFLNYIVELPEYASSPLANSNNRRTPPPPLRRKFSGFVHERDLVEKVSMGYRFDLQSLLIMC